VAAAASMTDAPVPTVMAATPVAPVAIHRLIRTLVMEF
jgi:hypothetical protein